MRQLRWLALFLTVWCGLAQNPTGTVVGRITDPTGAPVANAQLTLRNIDTNLLRLARADESGEYTLPNLPPGFYELIAEHKGFRKIHQTGIELQLDQTARLDIQMRVGSFSESVDVRAEVSLINTENAAKGDVIVTEEILEMPLDGRDFRDLAFLVPGILRRAEGGQGSQFAVAGVRSDNTNVIIDGFGDQSSRSGGVQVRPPLEAVDSFKMQTSGYSAEYGRLAGGVVNVMLKTPGNRFHATAFEFLRNDVLDARNFFDVGKSPLHRNQFGGTVDGPLIIPRLYDGSNRTFVVASWEGYHQLLGSTRRGRVPTALERAGDFSQTEDATGYIPLLRDPLAAGVCGGAGGGCFPGNVIPASRIHPVAESILPFYPQATAPGEVNNFLAKANDNDAFNTYLLKIDHRPSPRDSLGFRALLRQNKTSNPFSGSLLGIFGSKVDELQSLFGLNYTRLISPTLINEYRMGLTRTSHYETGQFIGQDFASLLGIPGTVQDRKLVGFPRFTIRDLAPLGDATNLPLQFTVNNFDWADTVTWVRGQHLVKFGAAILRTQYFETAVNNNRGSFDFLGRATNSSFGDFLLGLPNSTMRQVGTSPSYLFNTSYGFFVQDDWKVLPRLTLNLGVRYEIQKPLEEKYGRWGNFIPELGMFVLAKDSSDQAVRQAVVDAGMTNRIGLAGDYGLPSALTFTNYLNLAPRFGFAWRPLRSIRTVMRGGYGIYFANSMANPLRNDLSVVFPFTYLQTFQRDGSDPEFLTMSNPFPQTRGSIEGVNNSFGYQLRAPAQYIQSWSWTLEHQIGRESAFEVAYVGSKGTHLGRRYNLNQPLRDPESRLEDGSFPRPFAGFNDIQYYSFGSSSTYWAAMASLRKRFSRSVFYRFNYTYSKSIDDASQISGGALGGYGGAQDARNLGLERGRSDWDVGHSLTMAFVFEVPLGRNAWLRNWEVAATGRAYTGQPFTVRTSNVDLNQGEANRPDRLQKGQTLNPTVERWYDPAAFEAVPVGAYRFGNAGRNILDGPGYVAVNAALVRRFRVGERSVIQFRGEVFNVNNHPNFNLPNSNFNAINGGTITQAGDPRTLQLGLKYYF